MTLLDLGWNETFAREFAPLAAEGWLPGRLIRDNKISYGALIVEDGAFEEMDVIMSGKVYHDAETDADLPAVGDWVAIDPGDEQTDAVIRARLPRQASLSRKVPGDSSEQQVLAANVNTVAVVTDPGMDFNLRRMERYFTIISRSGAQATVLVNKSDLFPPEQNQEAVEAIRAIAPTGVAVHSISALEKKGLKAIDQLFSKGITVAFIGSSGVGKSAIINHLLGDEYQWTGEIHAASGRGRHTTTARELMVLRKGGIVIDNPGIKEVQMWTDETTLREPFADLEALASQCKFTGCKHRQDAGCAIRAAMEEGHLDPGRYEGFLKLGEEIKAIRQRHKKRQVAVERVAKRDRKVKARNKADRRQIERDLKPRFHEMDDD